MFKGQQGRQPDTGTPQRVVSETQGGIRIQGRPAHTGPVRKYLRIYSKHEGKPLEYFEQETDVITFSFLKESSGCFERIDLWSVPVRVL